MPQPRTPLLIAPADAPSNFGVGMHSSDLLRGLRKLNPRVTMPHPTGSIYWYPGQDAGMSCVWLGDPGNPSSIKISGIHLGMLPEFTLVGEKGRIIRKGWRAILDRAIKSRAITKQQAERMFRVSLDYEGFDPICRDCYVQGKRTLANGEYCDLHTSIRLQADRAKEAIR